MNASHRQFLKDMIPEVQRLGELQIRVMVEMRRELDVGGDIEIFRLMMRKQFERMNAAVIEFDGALYGGDESAPEMLESKS